MGRVTTYTCDASDCKRESKEPMIHVVANVGSEYNGVETETIQVELDLCNEHAQALTQRLVDSLMEDDRKTLVRSIMGANSPKEVLR